MENIYSQRLEMLRTLMRTKAWDAVIITGSDPHSSEYPALRWKQVEWLSGFTGEAGDLVVTLDHAGLWTDTRYFIQARRQLDGTGIELHKTRVPEQVLIPEWLEQQFGDEGLIAVVRKRRLGLLPPGDGNQRAGYAGSVLAGQAADTPDPGLFRGMRTDAGIQVRMAAIFPEGQQRLRNTAQRP